MWALASHTWVSSLFFRLWRTWFDFFSFLFLNENVSVHAPPHIKSTDYISSSGFIFQAASCPPKYLSTLSRQMKRRTWSISLNSEQYVRLQIVTFKSDPYRFNKMRNACVVSKALDWFCYHFIWNPPVSPGSSLIAVGLSGRRCQGREQCGGGNGHEPSRKDHFSAHRPPPHKLPAYGTVTPGAALRPAGREGSHSAVSFFISGESGGVWAEGPGDHQAEGWDRTNNHQRVTPYR